MFINKIPDVLNFIQLKIYSAEKRNKNGVMSFESYYLSWKREQEKKKLIKLK